MPRANPLQPSFNGGEFSPRMVARTDFAKYPLACATLQNMVPLPQGGATRRPGTCFVAEVKDSSKKVKLRRFEFSTEQAYVLECGEFYFRFYKDRGRIEVASTDAAIINGTFESGITGWTDKSNGTGVVAHDASDKAMALQANGSGNEAIAEQAVTTTATGQEHVLSFRVKGAAGDQATLRIGTSSGADDILAATNFAVGWHAKSFTPSAGSFFFQFENALTKTLLVDDVSIPEGAPVELAGPYREGELFEIMQAQSADVLYLVHSSYPVYKLTRSGHTSWDLIEAAFEDGPYLMQNASGTTLTPSATTGFGITLTASASAGINGGVGFKENDVGRLVRIDNPASGVDWGWARIVAFTSTTQVIADVKRDFGGASATAKWRLGAWCGECGYPGAVTFQEQRLAFAASAAQPQSFWLSQSADFQNMAPDSPDGGSGKWDGTVEDDDALDFTISADQVNAIQWLSPGRQLFIGTVGGEWVVRSNGPAITPTDVDVKRQTTFGSAKLPPQIMRGRTMFVQRAGRKLMEMAFNLEQDNFNSLDLNILADHITRGGIVDLAYQQEPDSTLWTVRADGEIPTLTYQPDQNVVGWARCVIGGASATGETVAVIPAIDRDEAWVCIRRIINGQVRRYVECFDAGFETGEIPALACYSDSALIYDGSATSSIFGLDHLEGEAVSILADGAVHPPRTVTAGAISLDYDAEKVIVGLSYTHIYESLKWEAGTVTGTAQGQVKRIHGVTLVLLDSLNASVGSDISNLKAIPFRAVGDAMDGAVPLFTGEKFIEFDGDFATDTRVVIQGDDPVPFTLLAVAPEIKTNTR
ncbi:MAG: hypothetical protein ACI9MJ_001922 [Alphaproteobacteria bacterium]|jgi:hypothetical protein